MNKVLQFARICGPGFLFAGAAVGVSHLVQSTRAGASFGYELIWVIVIVNLLKYPFFEFGPRYTAATGESLLQGYKRLGKWVIVLFLIVSILTVFAIQSAVTIVTAGIANYLMPFYSNGILFWTLIILGFSSIILLIGHYRFLDRFMKLVIILLSVSTVFAVFSAFGISNPDTSIVNVSFDWQNALHISFLIGLMGWMPAPIDLSVWHSLWAIEKRKINTNISWFQSRLDFNIGYIGTAFLAVCFLLLGALVMYNSGEQFSESGSGFANQLIGLYTISIGDWAKWIISIAALTTMFSTTITCLDAIPRVLAKTTVLLNDSKEFQNKENKLYWAYLFILILGSGMIIHFFSGKMLSLIQLATILSFLTAPFFAIANFKLVTAKDFPEMMRPKFVLKMLSWIGIIFLFLFIAIYLYFSFK